MSIAYDCSIMYTQPIPWGTCCSLTASLILMHMIADTVQPTPLGTCSLDLLVHPSFPYSQTKHTRSLSSFHVHCPPPHTHTHTQFDAIHPLHIPTHDGTPTTRPHPQDPTSPAHSVGVVNFTCKIFALCNCSSFSSCVSVCVV